MARKERFNCGGPFMLRRGERDVFPDDPSFPGASFREAGGSGIAPCACGYGSTRDERFRVEPTQEKFTYILKRLLTCTVLRATCQHTSSLEDIKFRQGKKGQLCSPATASQPGICARLAGTAPRGNSRQGNDVYQTHELARTVHLR